MTLTIGAQTAFGGEAAGMQTDREIQTLETYLRIRDGVAPSTDIGVIHKAFDNYWSSLLYTDKITNELSSHSANCERFNKLYSVIGGQLVEYYGQLISPQIWLADRGAAFALKQNIEGRLYTLKLFETALFSLALSGNEGGISELDPLAKEYCVTNGRQNWLSALVTTHNDLQILHETVFGLRSATDFNSSADIVRRLGEKAQRRHRIERIAWNVSELAGSIVLWFKGIAPVLRRASADVESPALRFVISVAAVAAYSVAFTKFDSEASKHLPFLQPGPSLKGMTLSKWNSLISKGEEVTRTKLNSPRLYFAYLKLIAVLDRQAAYGFLIQNQNFLAGMEKKYGSIDTALIHLKEEQENETINQRTG